MTETLLPRLTRRLLLSAPALRLRQRRNARVEPELQLVRRLLSRGGVLVDVGANAGTYVIAALAARARVLAVEPQPDLARKLRTWFPTSAVTVAQVAAAEQSGDAVLHLPIHETKVLGSRASLRADANEGFTHDAIVVSTATLDDLVSSHAGGQVDVVKIDVEGFECAVLRSATRTLTSVRPAVVVEVERRHHAVNPWEAFEILESFGYEGFFLRPDGNGLAGLEEFDPEIHQVPGAVKDPTCRARPSGLVNNFVFAHPESAQWQALGTLRVRGRDLVA